MLEDSPTIASTVRSIPQSGGYANGFDVQLRPSDYNKDVLAVHEVWALPNRHNLC